jgi:hypothetical protein
LDYRRFWPAAKPKNSEGPNRIISLHFPKAAGTSLKNQLQSLLGDDVLMDYSHDPVTPAGAATAEFPRGKRVVHGHFRASRYASSQAYWVTFLREPVDNLISIYFYWRSLRKPGHELHARFLRDKPSILEFSTYPTIQRLMSETYFGGFDMNRFDFIGFHDTRSRDMRTLAHALDLELQASIHDNKTAVTDERCRVLNDREVIGKLKHRLADDIEFYNVARARRVEAYENAALPTAV